MNIKQIVENKTLFSKFLNYKNLEERVKEEVLKLKVENNDSIVFRDAQWEQTFCDEFKLKTAAQDLLNEIKKTHEVKLDDLMVEMLDDLYTNGLSSMKHNFLDPIYTESSTFYRNNYDNYTLYNYFPEEIKKNVPNVIMMISSMEASAREKGYPSRLEMDGFVKKLPQNVLEDRHFRSVLLSVDVSEHFKSSNYNDLRVMTIAINSLFDNSEHSAENLKTAHKLLSKATEEILPSLELNLYKHYGLLPEKNRHNEDLIKEAIEHRVSNVKHIPKDVKLSEETLNALKKVFIENLSHMLMNYSPNEFETVSKRLNDFTEILNNNGGKYEIREMKPESEFIDRHTYLQNAGHIHTQNVYSLVSAIQEEQAGQKVSLSIRKGP